METTGDFGDATALPKGLETRQHGELVFGVGRLEVGISVGLDMTPLLADVVAVLLLM